MTIRASSQFAQKLKFRSRLTALQNRKLDNGLVTTLCTYMPRGKKYPYASVKRNGYKDVVDGLVPERGWK